MSSMISLVSSALTPEEARDDILLYLDARIKSEQTVRWMDETQRDKHAREVTIRKLHSVRADIARISFPLTGVKPNDQNL